MTQTAPIRPSVGYCTNVHPGVDLASIRQNLLGYAVPVRHALGATDRLGVGLWLPYPAMAELDPSAVASFADFLSEHQLNAFTINGFPYENFHQPVVKRRVYSPPWWDPARLAYTLELARVLAQWLPAPGAVGSISTLPIGWPPEALFHDRDAARRALAGELALAADHLCRLAESLAEIEAETGRRIVVAIEPEPGCLLQNADDVIEWFDRHLDGERQRRYLTVCHDICHSGVMMEDQAETLRRYAGAGIGVGKVQVSNALVVDWESMAMGRRREAAGQLAEFAEDRYLHQTGRRTADGGFELAEDLPQLLGEPRAGGGRDDEDPAGGDRRWVIHFHVPIFLERFGRLSTTQSDVIACLRTLADPQLSLDFTGHLEIETYAWSVLPESMRRRGLVEDITEEFRWLRQAMVEAS